MLKLKKLTILVIIFLLLISNIITIGKETCLINIPFNNQIRNLHPVKSNIFNFCPEDINLKDDAFHGFNIDNCVEWWYFDATLNGDYSVQIIIYVFNYLKTKFVITQLNIFKDGIILENKEKIYLKNDFVMSIDTPFIAINEKQVLKGYISDKTGKWVYNVSIDMIDSSADLHFIGCAKGWKGNLTIGGWAAILPKADVNGTIKIKNEEYEVTGQGYHDHNWGIKLRIMLKYGWYWGRIISRNYSIVYYNIMDTRISYNQIALIIANETTYTNIEPADMNFLALDFHLENWRFIPHNFLISANNQNVSFFIVLNAFKLYHGGMTFGLRNYWRYFAKTLGYIKTNSEIEEINGMQIAEFWKFR